MANRWGAIVVVASVLALAPDRAAGEGTTLAVEVTTPGAPAAAALGIRPRFSLDDCQTPGVCWEVGDVMTVSVTLYVAGQSKHCAKRCRVPVNFAYRIDASDWEIDGGFTFGCNGGFATIVGGSVRRQRRKAFLIPANVDEVEQSLRTCSAGVRPTFSSWVRPSADLNALRGKTAVRARYTVASGAGEGRVWLGTQFRHRGVPLGSPTGPVVGEKLSLCPAELVVRCELTVPAS
jgi:hypothetical protein